MESKYSYFFLHETYMKYPNVSKILQAPCKGQLFHENFKLFE